MKIEHSRPQMINAEETPEYIAFVDKFKLKKTTDDCYTPPIVYEAIRDYVVTNYGIQRDKIIRPFWPGADYQRTEYPADCCVVDNPPFSIITAITRWYMAHGINFFLFAPYLTNFNTNIPGVCHIIAPHTITYENGAKVATCFLTNMEPGTLARSDPKLLQIVAEADEINQRKTKGAPLPKYSYPSEVLTATMLGYMANHGVTLIIKEKDAFYIRALDAQRKDRKTIFGGGYLLAEKAAAEKAAAEKAAAEKAAAVLWQLSDREKDIVKKLNHE